MATYLQTLSTNNTYVQPTTNIYPQNCYTCGNCGAWINGYQPHTCYYSPPTTTQIIVTNPIPTPGVDFNLNKQLQEVKEELNEVRKTLEKLMELAVNGHEEVRGRDERRGGDEGADPEGSFEGSVHITYSPEVTRILGL